MKKSIIFAFSMVITAIFCSLAVAGWELYDDFESGIIDPVKWDIDDSSANIAIVNGEAKFIHLSGHAGDFAKLILKQSPDTILGIKAKVSIESCTGDVSTRNFGWIGEDQEGNWIAFSLNIGPNGQDINYYVHAWDPVSRSDAYSLLDGYFKKPLEIIGKSFIVSTRLDSGKKTFNFSVENLGYVEFVTTQIISNTSTNQKFIGTKSENGDGPCTIYFDDVYVYRQIPSAATNLLLLEEQ